MATAIYLRPSFQLGTKYQLSLNARVYLEEEFTQPDNSTGRRFNPLDTWVWLSAKKLYEGPVSKIRIAGSFRAVIPTSYESRYQNTITILTPGVSAVRPFEFGSPDKEGKKWELAVSLGTPFSKYLQTSIYRGSAPVTPPAARQPEAMGAGGRGRRFRPVRRPDQRQFFLHVVGQRRADARALFAVQHSHLDKPVPLRA